MLYNSLEAENSTEGDGSSRPPGLVGTCPGQAAGEAMQGEEAVPDVVGGVNKEADSYKITEWDV